MARYDYDLICIGLGPAGMAVSIMGSKMGLKVCAIEKNKIGGECMNAGCIPSKSLLKMAKARQCLDRFMAHAGGEDAAEKSDCPFEKIRGYVQYIGEKKTLGMFDQVDLVLGEGAAQFVDPHTVTVGSRTLTAKRVFIAVGTRPKAPPIPGLESVDYLTNENLFSLDCVPKSMTIIGGGAIGCEMAEAFNAFGCKCNIVHLDSGLIPTVGEETGRLLQQVFERQGIGVYNGRSIKQVEKTAQGVKLTTDREEILESGKLLLAAGREMDLSSLAPEKAGLALEQNGALKINNYLQTSQPHIYAVGDCNGQFLLSHAAMHQGMIAIMNSMTPWPFKQNFRKFVVPWTVFTNPEVSNVGMTEKQLQERGISYQVIESRYQDYGAAIAENVETGYVRALVSKLGKIYGVTIVGEGSGEMINEWALAIQKKIRLHDIMMLQHSFPTMGFLTKRTSEEWMMGNMKSPFLQNMCRFMFRMGKA